MENPVTWVLNQIKRLNDIIWHTPLLELSRGKTFIFKQLRILILAAKGFSNDKVQLRASALTFYSLLSVIPIAAIAFAIAKGFGFEQILEQSIINKFQSYHEILDKFLPQVMQAIDEAKGGI